jgi:hypothetical protein
VAEASLASQSIAFEVRAGSARLAGTLATLRAMSLTAHFETKARDDAVALLESAQAYIAQSRYEDAIAALLAAGGALDAITSVAVRESQAAIDLVAKEVEARWWSALPACGAATAGAPCRTP